MSMKDAYYFPHDSNAHDDPKCMMLIEQLGLEGYGIYWILIEMLRDQNDYSYPLALLPALARRFNSTLEKFKTVVMNYYLFEVKDDRIFYSPSLVSRMNDMNEKRQKLSLAGKKGNALRWGKQLAIGELSQGDSEAITMQSQYDDRLIATKGKERKGKENKEKENKGEESITALPSRSLSKFSKPNLIEVKKEFEIKAGVNSDVEAEKFFNYYEANGWKVGKNQMKNWKAAVSQWITRSKEWAPNGNNQQQSVISGVFDSIAFAEKLKNK